jgi:hypothetical protein
MSDVNAKRQARFDRRNDPARKSTVTKEMANLLGGIALVKGKTSSRLP